MVMPRLALDIHGIEHLLDPFSAARPGPAGQLDQPIGLGVGICRGRICAIIEKLRILVDGRLHWRAELALVPAKRQSVGTGTHRSMKPLTSNGSFIPPDGATDLGLARGSALVCSKVG